jgi:hypothetical protein
LFLWDCSVITYSMCLWAYAPQLHRSN